MCIESALLACSNSDKSLHTHFCQRFRDMYW